MTDALATQLDQLEHQFNQIALILADGDAEALPQASEILQGLSCEVLELIGSGRGLYSLNAAQRQRLSALSRGMVLIHETLARRAAFVNQALEIVLPTPPKATYGQARGAFGSPFQQSGQIRQMSA
jgi:hypothetical protein